MDSTRPGFGRGVSYLALAQSFPLVPPVALGTARGYRLEGAAAVDPVVCPELSSESPPGLPFLPELAFVRSHGVNELNNPTRKKGAL